MAVLTEYLILSQESPLQHSHQDTALSGQIAVNFSLKGRLKKMPGTNRKCGCNTTISGLARVILVNGE